MCAPGAGAHDRAMETSYETVRALVQARQEDLRAEAARLHRRPWRRAEAVTTAVATRRWAPRPAVAAPRAGCPGDPAAA